MGPNEIDATAGSPDAGKSILARAGTSCGMTRPQLGLFFAGVTGLLVSGAGYGNVAKTATDSRATASTSFGSLQVLRAGRFARLAANGIPSALRGREALAAMGGGLRLPFGAAAGAGSGSGHSQHGGHAGGSTAPDVSGNSIPGLRWR